MRKLNPHEVETIILVGNVKLCLLFYLSVVLNLCVVKIVLIHMWTIVLIQADF